MSFIVRPAMNLQGEIYLQGDKSIAHRSLILSGLCRGKTSIENFPVNKDCLYTLNALKKLGLKIVLKKDKRKFNTAVVYGKGLNGLKAPRSPVFVGDSGTTMRLLLGVLAGQDFIARVEAGKYLSLRPMLRVIYPLRLMGSQINARSKLVKGLLEQYPPVTVKGARLKAISYKIPVASAQVKSAILLAGLYAIGCTKVVEPTPTRDHTERMLKLFKVKIKNLGKEISLKGGQELFSPGKVYVPGDISSASFFMVAALIVPGSRILIKSISLNPSRIGIINVLKRMGADIKIRRSKMPVSGAEPMGDVIIKTSRLKGVTVKKQEVPTLIDELPILMVAACFARGKSVFEGVEELRVKETDRINSMLINLRAMGAEIKAMNSLQGETMVVNGAAVLKGAAVKSFGDHRTAMSLVVAGLAAEGRTEVDDLSCINKSFPAFISLLDKLKQ